MHNILKILCIFIFFRHILHNDCAFFLICPLVNELFCQKWTFYILYFYIHYKGKIVFLCLLIYSMVYSFFSDDYNITLLKKDGESVKKGEIIATVEARVATMLSGERVTLNLMQLMCGIATTTRKYVDNLNDDNIRDCDTRKTHPGLRVFEKYAVTCGGGFNHRFALYDGVMLKDNHIAFAGGITKAVKLVKSKLHRQRSTGSE